MYMAEEAPPEGGPRLPCSPALPALAHLQVDAPAPPQAAADRRLGAQVQQAADQAEAEAEAPAKACGCC